jgi:predicted small lipoprotein YifL
MQLKVSVAFSLSILLLAACGQIGPLYLPGNPSQIQTEIPPQDPVTGVEDEEDEDEDKDSRQ